MHPHIEPSRRELFELLGAGLVFPLVTAGAGSKPLGSRLHIAPDGMVTLLTGKVEIGQGCRTLLAQCVAEEMGVPLAKVRLIMGDTDLVLDDGGTFASLTTPLAVPMVRQAAAAARDLLRTLQPGEAFPDAAMLREIPVQVDLTPPARWKVLGTPQANVNGRAIVTGALKYAGDKKVSGMLAGKAVRAEAYSAELVSFDGAAAERIPGVRVVRDGGFLGVVAPDEETAGKAAGVVRAEWRERSLMRPAELLAHFRKTAVAPLANSNTRYPPLFEKGSPASALAQAEKTLEAEYTLPPIAHVPLEPRAAVAAWEGGKLTLYCTTQVPFGCRKELARAFQMAETQVRLIVSDMGGGFGSKHGAEVMVEAARLAKAAGQPVRVAWTREEEFARAVCRPPALVEVRSGMSGDGRITAWEFRNYHSGAASLAVPYAIPNYRCGHYRCESPLRQGPYRSLAAVANTFARESQVEEMAAMAQRDAVEFRLRNLENPRLREVIERAAERFGWGKQRGAVGMACNLEKDGHMALFAELDGSRSAVRVRRMVIAFDCGAVLNPDNLRNQVTGAVIMGIGGALFEELRYDARKVLSTSLSGYRVPRFSDAPAVEVILVDRREVTPAGAGESPITVVAPALAAALFRADGKRRRNLPLS